VSPFSAVTSVAFHPENQCLASGSADKTLHMWDIRSHLLIQHYQAHDDEITSISMHSVRLIMLLSMTPRHCLLHTNFLPVMCVIL
jgi:centriolar protein POC1